MNWKDKKGVSNRWHGIYRFTFKKGFTKINEEGNR
jgi:hypothetical protein